MTTDRQAAISDIGAFVDDYVEFYALDDGECYHEPTEHERLLIEDAINGLVADDKFEELMAAPITAERDALRAEVERLRAACSRENDTISQVLGRALGYPRFADDQKNFPGATDADGVCVGDHVAASLADEAANVIRALRSEVERLRADLPAAYQRGYTEALNDCIRNGGEQWARSMFADGGDAIDAARAAQEGKG